MILKISIVAAAIFLVACAPKQDTDFFKKNEADRIAKVAECSSALATSGDVAAFETDPLCVASFLAEPYNSPEFWREHKTLRLERLSTCKSLGIELKGSSTCQSVYKFLSAGMSRGVPVKATFDPGAFK